MIQLDELDQQLQDILAELGKHPKVSIGLGQKAVFVYVIGRQTEKMVASKIPQEYLTCVQIVRTGGILPATKRKTR